MDIRKSELYYTEASFRIVVEVEVPNKTKNIHK